MPFGVLTASDEFQRVTDEVFCGLDGVTVVVDDILVWGRTREEHDNRLRKVLHRCEEVGIVLNKQKSQFAKDSVKYLGHVLTTEGMKIDQDRIRSIQEFPAPTNVKQLQQFLGMVTYVSQFVDHLSDKTVVLRELIKRSSGFDWQPVHQEAFEHLKEALVSAPVLQYFDPQKTLTLSVDASIYGVGAVMTQDGKPVAYASKSLTDPQTRWAQIERELLAIVFGCQKFHYFVYGRPEVNIETDHRPLEQIFRKPLHQVPLRLQQMRMSLQKYDIKVTYRPGKELQIADFLSRNPLPERLIYNPKINAIKHIAISESRLADYQRASTEDQETTELARLFRDGWPDNKQSVPDIARTYWPYRDEIHVEDNLTMRSNRIIVPSSKRREVLKQLHAAHCGETKMKNRARDTVYWPSINAEIEQFAKSCQHCQEHQRRKQKEPMIIGKIPVLPWEIVSADILTHEDRNYQVLVDHYSFYWTICRLEKMTTKHVIKSMFGEFQHFGLPRTLLTDNGPQYVSADFEDVMRKYDIEHKTSSPYHPLGNSIAERAVQEAKKILRKYKFDTPEFYVALAEFRVSPRTTDLASPVERLQGRRLRTLVPAHASTLEPRTLDPAKVAEALLSERKKQKAYYDRTSRSRPEFEKGQRVRIWDRREEIWKDGTVVGKHAAPRSYSVWVRDTDSCHRRNKKDIALQPDQTPNEAHQPNQMDDGDEPQASERALEPEQVFRRSHRERKERTICSCCSEN